MRRRTLGALALFAAFAVGCSSSDSPSAETGDASTTADATGPDAALPGTDASSGDSGTPGVDAGADAPDDATPVDAGADVEGGCVVFSVTGQCIAVSSCAALGNHTSYSGYCPGPADIECCVDTENQPVPAGWVLMQQAQVTSAMTTWAVMILDDPTTYPMYATTTMFFGALDVMARVEWHPPDANNEVVHRGVTLYEPTD